MRVRQCLLMCGIVVVAGCLHRGGGGGLTPVGATARVYYDDSPAYRDSVRMIVREVSTWQMVWARATSTQASPAPLPAIDFSREIVVLVGAGRMTPGDQIHVDSVGVRGGVFVVVVRTTVECRPFPAEAYPMEIVRVSRSDKTPSFVERRERAAHCQ